MVTNELISRKLRATFEDALAADSTLLRIRAVFDAAGIVADTTYKPIGKGERRVLIAQYCHTLDLTNIADALRLLRAYAASIEDFESRVRGEASGDSDEAQVTSLKACLGAEGLGYANGKITATTPEARAIFESPKPAPSITEITRREIFDRLIIENVVWHGSLGEVEFLDRLFDLRQLPSNDPRLKSMRADVHQHRVHNFDWQDDWVYWDRRLNLLHGPDGVLLRFLCEMVHPVVRREPTEASGLVAIFNEHLPADGWVIVPGKPTSGRPTYDAHRRSTCAVALPEPEHAHDMLSDEYVNELSDKCDLRLASGDLDGAITVGRTLLEAVLGELELRLAGERGDYQGDMPKQFKAVTKLLRMDEQRPDLDERFKNVIRGLVMIANGLAPLRNKLSDGHARVRKPALHHARVVVNAAKTVASFLVESYQCQKNKGLIQAAQPEKHHD